MEKLKRGFTLIELLVVISIIGILTSLALVSYSGAQKQARDSQRRSDLNQYRNGLEEYAASNNGFYPEYTGGNRLTAVCNNDLGGFLSDCPDDPLGTNYYMYLSASGGSDFILYAQLETGGFWYVCSSGKVDSKSTTPGLGDC